MRTCSSLLAEIVAAALQSVHKVWTLCSLTVCNLSVQVWLAKTPSAQNCAYNISNGEWDLNLSHPLWLYHCILCAPISAA